MPEQHEPTVNTEAAIAAFTGSVLIMEANMRDKELMQQHTLARSLFANALRQMDEDPDDIPKQVAAEEAKNRFLDTFINHIRGHHDT